jgi:hypothetical protein
MGRRPVIFGALGLVLVSAALFLVADGVAWLYAGRILQGWRPAQYLAPCQPHWSI